MITSWTPLTAASWACVRRVLALDHLVDDVVEDRRVVVRGRPQVGDTLGLRRVGRDEVLGRDDVRIRQHRVARRRVELRLVEADLERDVRREQPVEVAPRRFGLLGPLVDAGAVGALAPSRSCPASMPGNWRTCSLPAAISSFSVGWISDSLCMTVAMLPLANSTYASCSLVMLRNFGSQNPLLRPASMVSKAF